MPSQLSPRFFQQALKRDPLFGEPPLQGPSAQMQLSCEILYPWAPTREQLLQNAFCLFAESFLRELLRQFRLKLWRDNREQISIMSYKRKLHICLAEY